MAEGKFALCPEYSESAGAIQLKPNERRRVNVAAIPTFLAETKFKNRIIKKNKQKNKTNKQKTPWDWKPQDGKILPRDFLLVGGPCIISAVTSQSPLATTSVNFLCNRCSAMHNTNFIVFNLHATIDKCLIFSLFYIP